MMQDAPEITKAKAALARPYNLYFSTGNYDRRYPAPNPRTLNLVRAHLPADGHVIDYGCGSGRYLVPLLAPGRRVAGFDISQAALDLLRARTVWVAEDDLSLLGPDPADLDNQIVHHGRADVVLCLFGVLAHITDPVERRATLVRLASLVKPGEGRLIISVPNRRRRFFREQRRSQDGGGAIRYSRAFGATSVALDYQLFDPQSLRRELEAAGFVCERLQAESVLPESWLSNNAAWRMIDGVVTPLCPAAWGYGILAVARLAEEP